MCSTVRIQPGRTTSRVVVSGDVDLSTSAGLRSAVRTVVDDGASEVVFDLSHVEFIDCAGYAACLRSVRDVRASGLRTRVVGGFAVNAFSHRRGDRRLMATA